MIDKLKDLIGIKEDEGAKSDQRRAEQMAELEKELAQALMMDMAPQRKEPDLRSIGLFADVSEERIAELIHAMLYLNEVNKVNKTKTPITFYLSTYGGSADDMFGMYDIMRQVREETEIHTIGLGKVMSAGVILLASGTKGKRKIGKNCRVMIHNVITGQMGAINTVEHEMKEERAEMEAFRAQMKEFDDACEAGNETACEELEAMMAEVEEEASEDKEDSRKDREQCDDEEYEEDSGEEEETDEEDSDDESDEEVE